ncbi:12548_t:CDS:2, partial [Rhizophagus irregularis]
IIIEMLSPRNLEEPGKVYGKGSWNNFSHFLDDSKQFFVVSRRFLDNSFLDDSWTWSAFEQFLGETSWFFGWET